MRERVCLTLPHSPPTPTPMRDQSCFAAGGQGVGSLGHTVTFGFLR